MEIKVKRFDKSLPLPAYKSDGAACLDLYCRKTTTIAPHTVKLIPLNVAVEIPQGYWLMIAARGSTHKLGIMPVHGIGIGDWDFRGDDDEYFFPALNFTDEEVTIEKGTRIAQMMVSQVEEMTVNEVDKLGNKNRGKFGSTGYE